MHQILRLAAPVVTAALLVACDRGTATPTSTPSPTASVIATAPVPPTATASASATATPSPTPTAFPTAPAGPTPPPGVRDVVRCRVPVGEAGQKAFVCFEQPSKGASVNRGGTLTVSGYAGGSFENNVVVEVRTVSASGELAPGTIVKMPTT